MQVLMYCPPGTVLPNEFTTLTLGYHITVGITIGAGGGLYPFVYVLPRSAFKSVCGRKKSR